MADGDLTRRAFGQGLTMETGSEVDGGTVWRDGLRRLDVDLSSNALWPPADQAAAVRAY